jgi:hypothetical protein
MTLIVETGAGLTTANTMASMADADSYHSVRANSDWDDADYDAKEAALVKASAYLCDETRFPWVGTKAVGYNQRMPWPRTGAVETDGTVVPDNVVPWRVVDAVCALAGLSVVGTDLQPPLEHGGQIVSESVGAISVTYAAGAPTGTFYQAAEGLVAPLLRNRSHITVGPRWIGGDGAVFDLGMHDV